MFTILRNKTLIGLYTEQARLQALVQQLEVRLADKQRDLDGAGQECADLKDDLRKVFGLKPRVAVAPVPPPSEMDTPISGNRTEQFKMKETPRDYLARMQREHDAEVKQQDQDAIRQAIAESESVLAAGQ